jgi:outer membrane protein OmpA-like peptidoglycan-associated protein
MPEAQQIFRSKRTACGNRNAALFFSQRGALSKPRMNEPGDSDEREADTMANRVMQTSDPMGQSRIMGSPATAVQRKENDASAESKKSNNKFNFFGSTARPLSETSRRFFEPRFGQDFSNVRIHTGEEAAKSAESVNARAYTAGNHIVFNAGQYAADKDSGKKLLAHELTHVVQQGKSTGNVIQRKLKVENPNDNIPGTPEKQAWDDVRDSIKTLSSNFGVNSDGIVAAINRNVCNSPDKNVEHCLCDLSNSDDDWKIHIQDEEWPHTDDGLKTIFIPSSRSGIEKGFWGGGSQKGKRVDQPLWRVIGHEMCGHAWLFYKGAHPTSELRKKVGDRWMSREGHDPNIAVENAIAEDVLGRNAPKRGFFADPHSGESFGKVSVSGFEKNKDTISPSMASRFDIVEKFMKHNGYVKADIVGHADSTESNAEDSATARAQSVKSELVNRGIDAVRFNAVAGTGASECATQSPREDPLCRAADVFIFTYEKASLNFP